MNETYQKAYKDARDVILQEIGLYLEGLQSVADHCKDERAAFAMNKYVQKINDALSSNLFGYND